MKGVPLIKEQPLCFEEKKKTATTLITSSLDKCGESNRRVSSVYGPIQKHKLDEIIGGVLLLLSFFFCSLIFYYKL